VVEVLGHFAMALLWALPAWYRWDGRVSLAFVGFVLATAMLPDVDLVLRTVLPGVHHHGVTHTVAFVSAVALVAGVVVARGLLPRIERWWIRSEGHAIPRADAYAFVVGGLLFGGLSHVFADVLSAPDVASPVEPLWPFLDEPIVVDAIYYAAPEWNGGLLLVALALHGLVVYADVAPIADAVGRRGV